MRMTEARRILLGAAGLLVLAGCTHYPITDGYSKTLPTTQTVVTVWGGHPLAASTAVNWLNRRGVAVLEKSKVVAILKERAINTTEDEAAILKAAKLAGVTQVVFLETPIFAGSASVALRAVDTETAQVVWSGQAHYEIQVHYMDSYLPDLTCQALATAWGFRPGGQRRISWEKMCHSPEGEKR